MFSFDNTQTIQIAQLSPIGNDIMDLFQYTQAKYENQKNKRSQKRKSLNRSFDNSSLDGDDSEFTSSTFSLAKFRHRKNIQSEQKRRAEINNSFEELCRQLPSTYTRRKMSTAELLQKAVSHIKNQSSKESFFLNEINRLRQNCNNLMQNWKKKNDKSKLLKNISDWVMSN
ncbi:36191_t:CDS:2 [Gigaspora margarita]|uniref:36191_t:CDS:1 n=1 Tax=Gigaspora margarita TaxID=4874 RepID=A0ABN7VT07_GIGMA|nr:36191_t:CDS:2 [Gigaspora margarita]